MSAPSSSSQWEPTTDEHGRSILYNRLTGARRPNEESNTPRGLPQNGAPTNPLPSHDRSPVANLLNSRFKRQSSDFFEFGRVFLILWSAPTSQSVSSNPSEITPCIMGENVFSRIRRFVVISERDQYCTALPVSTYSYQGVAKPRVKKSDHAIIYTGRDAPHPTQFERASGFENGMRPISIKVDPDSRSTKLDPMSRIDLARVFPIEHNLKVVSFGKVVNKNDLLNQFRQVSAEYDQQRAAGSTQAPGGNSGTGRLTQSNIRQLGTQDSYTHAQPSSSRNLAVHLEENERNTEDVGGSTTRTNLQADTSSDAYWRILEFLMRDGLSQAQAVNEARLSIETRSIYNRCLDRGMNARDAVLTLATSLQSQGIASLELALNRISDRLQYATG